MLLSCRAKAGHPRLRARNSNSSSSGIAIMHVRYCTPCIGTPRRGRCRNARGILKSPLRPGIRDHLPTRRCTMMTSRRSSPVSCCSATRIPAPTDIRRDHTAAPSKFARTLAGRTPTTPAVFRHDLSDLHRSVTKYREFYGPMRPVSPRPAPDEKHNTVADFAIATPTASIPYSVPSEAETAIGLGS